MRVLYVTPFRLDSKNIARGVFADRQITSLGDAGVDCGVYVVEGNTDPRAIVRNVFNLRKLICSEKYDIVHAMYGSVTGMVACVAALGRCRVVVSFCGSDLNGSRAVARLRSWFGVVLSQVAACMAAVIICKSRRLADRLWFRRTRAHVIPNGVDLSHFRRLDRADCRRKLGLEPTVVYLLFNDGNSDPVKRVDLAGEVARLLGAALAPRFVRLLILRSVEPTDVVVYLGAVDALIVTSDCEGSPNIVKEGIACRTPIVSYDVGDVAERLLDVPFGRIVDRDPSAMVEALREVVDSATPNELDPSVMDAIDERAVARAIIGLYGTGL